MNEATIPPPRPSYYVYAIIDPRETPIKLIAVQLSRAEARKHIVWSKDADSLRIRRAKLLLYDS